MSINPVIYALKGQDHHNVNMRRHPTFRRFLIISLKNAVRNFIISAIHLYYPNVFALQ